MPRLIIASFAAAVTTFVLGFLFWGLAPISPFSPTPSGAEELPFRFPADGAYMIPDPTAMSHEAAVDAAAEGYALVFVRPSGVDMGGGSVLARGFLVMFLAMLLLGLLLGTADRPDRGYAWRLAFCLCVGGVATVWSTLGLAIWWHLPWEFPGLNVVYDLLAFTAGGAVLAKLIGAGAAADTVGTTDAWASKSPAPTSRARAGKRPIL